LSGDAVNHDARQHASRIAITQFFAGLKIQGQGERICDEFFFGIVAAEVGDALV
jgi:hypothetical protein